MNRLIKVDPEGTWKLIGTEWNYFESLTTDTWERVYAALCRLRDYEATGLDPDGVRMAHEKQVPEEVKRIVKKDEGYSFYHYVCPSCLESIGYNFDNEYCPHCGQALKWEEVENE